MEKWQIMEWQIFIFNLALLITGLFLSGIILEKWLKNIKITTFMAGLFTFHFVAFCWIFFRAGALGSSIPSGDLLGKVLSKLTTIRFDISFFAEMNDKTPYVLPAILIGFGLHFSPSSIKEFLTNWFSRQSFILQAIFISMIITAALILNTQRNVPFIYFQF